MSAKSTLRYLLAQTLGSLHCLLLAFFIVLSSKLSTCGLLRPSLLSWPCFLLGLTAALALAGKYVFCHNSWFFKVLNCTSGISFVWIWRWSSLRILEAEAEEDASSPTGKGPYLWRDIATLFGSSIARSSAYTRIYGRLAGEIRSCPWGLLCCIPDSISNSTVSTSSLTSLVCFTTAVTSLDCQEPFLKGARVMFPSSVAKAEFGDDPWKRSFGEEGWECWRPPDGWRGLRKRQGRWWWWGRL